MATLRSVARLAGVSAGTASAAFTGSQPVSPERRSAVLRAAAVLGYEPPPQPASRCLRVQVLSGAGGARALTEDPFYGGIFDGVRRALATRGPTAITYRWVGEPRAPRRTPSPQAVFLLAVRPDAHLRSRCRRMAGRVPVVAIDELLTDCGADSVITDDLTATLQVVQRLCALGYRRFVVVAGPRQFSSFRIRRAGALEGLLRSGVPLSRCLTLDAPATVAGGEAAAQDLVRTWRGGRIAVIAANDAQAVGVLSGVRRHGWRIPEDAAVVGFDDVAGPEAGLSSVAVPRALLGELAVGLALRRLAGGAGVGEPATTVSVAPRLIERASTGPVGPRTVQRGRAPEL